MSLPREHFSAASDCHAACNCSVHFNDRPQTEKRETRNSRCQIDRSLTDSWEHGSRQFLDGCSRRCNGRWSEMPRKWQVQLGPNFIKHNPICALILPRRLVASVTFWGWGRQRERGRKREKRRALATPEPPVGVSVLRPFFFFFYLCSRDGQIDLSDAIARNYTLCVTTTKPWQVSVLAQRKKHIKKRKIRLWELGHI